MAKGRSPSYPGVPLEKAIELTRELYEKEHLTTVRPDVAVQAWGHEGLSGPSRRKLAALKYFGLVDDVEGGVQVSKLGEGLLHPHDQQEERRLIREAALNPEIFKEIFKNFARASDTSITSHLVRERHFNTNGAQKFVDVFRETIKFANLESSSVQERQPDDNNGREGQNDDTGSGSGSGGSGTGRTPRKRESVAEGNVVDVFNLGSVQVAFERPKVLSQDQFDDLEAWVNLILQSAKRSIRAEGSSDDDTEGE